MAKPKLWQVEIFLTFYVALLATSTLTHHGITRYGIAAASKTSTSSPSPPVQFPDRAVVEENSGVIQFSHKGKASVQMGHAFILTDFPLHASACVVEQIYATVQAAIPKINETEDHWYLEELKADFSTRLAPAQHDLTGLLAALGITDFDCATINSLRQKRVLMTFLAGAVMFGGVALTQLQMANMRNDIANLRDNQQVIVRRIKAQDTLIGRNTEAIQDLFTYTQEQIARVQRRHETTRAITLAADIVNDIRHITNMVKQNRLDATLVHAAPLQKQIDSINAIATARRLFVPNLTPAAIYNYPTSYEFNSTHVTLFTKIPLLSQKFEVDVVRFNQMPFKTADGWVQFQTSKPYLAVTQRPTGLFIAMSPEEFGSCQNLAGYLICPELPMFKKRDGTLNGRDNDRCLHALFSNDPSSMIKFCTLERADSVERIVSLGYNKYVIFTPKRVTLRVDCPGVPLQRYEINHVATIYLPPACMAETDANFVWGFTDIMSTSPEVQHITFIKGVVDDLQKATKSQIRRMISGEHTIQEQINETKRLEEENRSWADSINHPSGIISILVGSLLGLAALYGIYRCFIRREEICIRHIVPKMSKLVPKQPGGYKNNGYDGASYSAQDVPTVSLNGKINPI
jgi:hypothetical protein